MLSSLFSIYHALPFTHTQTHFQFHITQVYISQTWTRPQLAYAAGRWMKNADAVSYTTQKRIQHRCTHTAIGNDRHTYMFVYVCMSLPSIYLCAVRVLFTTTFSTPSLRQLTLHIHTFTLHTPHRVFDCTSYTYIYLDFVPAYLHIYPYKHPCTHIKAVWTHVNKCVWVHP